MFAGKATDSLVRKRTRLFCARFLNAQQILRAERSGRWATLAATQKRQLILATISLYRIPGCITYERARCNQNKLLNYRIYLLPVLQNLWCFQTKERTRARLANTDGASWVQLGLYSYICVLQGTAEWQKSDTEPAPSIFTTSAPVHGGKPWDLCCCACWRTMIMMMRLITNCCTNTGDRI